MTRTIPILGSNANRIEDIVIEFEENSRLQPLCAGRFLGIYPQYYKFSYGGLSLWPLNKKPLRGVIFFGK